MKSILFSMMVLFSLSTWANIGVSHINKKFQDLNRIQHVTLDGVDYEFGFVTEVDAAYFQVPYDQFQMSIQIPHKKTNFLINIVINDTLISFEVPNGSVKGKFEATKTSIKVTEYYDSPSGISLFSSTKSTGPATKITIELKKPLFGTESISDIVTRTGSLDFNPCDGCEHGDQMLVNGINVVDLDFGAYYTADCSGTVHRLLGQLLEFDPNNENEDNNGLAVPFTFKGLINLDSGDLIEDLDTMWVADKKAGELFIGNTVNIPMPRFLDSMVYKVAQQLNVEAHTIWDDVMEKGNFTSYKNNVLTFTYKNVVVKTNL